MNKLIVLATVVVACGASLVQAEMKNGVENGMPSSSSSSSSSSPSGSNTMSMDNMNNNDNMKGMDMNGMGMKGMDTNGDTMISKREWKAYHDMIWNHMKSKNGKVPMTDVEAMLKKC